MKSKFILRERVSDELAHVNHKFWACWHIGVMFLQGEITYKQFDKLFNKIKRLQTTIK